jgi:GAF domain-containing protein
MRETSVAVSEPKTWRQLLAALISAPEERKRIARDSGIDVATLKRYADNQTKRIRMHMVRPLVAAVPGEYRAKMIALILEEFPGFTIDVASASSEEPAQPDGSAQVQRQVVDRALLAHTTTPLSLRFWAICQIVMAAAIEQLDPGSQPTGVKVVIAQCICPPDSQVVHYLRETFLLGTPPWITDQTMPLFLGAESLSGYAVTSGRPAICQDLRKNLTFLPVRQEEHEESAAAYPLLQGERVGGCFLVSAAQPHFFTPQRLQLIEDYRDLVNLALRDRDFFALEAIQLRTMPETPVQRTHFNPASFRSRVNALVSSSERQVANIVEAEQRVWIELGEELMNLNP